MLTNERLISLEKVGEYQIITWEKQFEENKQGIIVQDSLLSENIQVRSQECIDKKHENIFHIQLKKWPRK